MSSTQLDLSPSTWRMLGLSVAVSYLGFGTLVLLGPSSISAGLLGLPSPTPARILRSISSSTSDSAFSSEKSAHIPGVEIPNAEAKADLVVKRALRLLGARDVSLGFALILLDQMNMPQAMGAVILCSLLLVAADAWSLFTARGAAWGVGTAGGAVFWGWIGWNLLNLSRW